MPNINGKTQIVIHDEATRRALESASWSLAHDLVTDDTLSSPFYHAYADVAISEDDGSVGAALQLVDDVNGVIGLVNLMRATEVGASISIDVPAASLARALKSVLYAIEEDEEFWERPEKRREQMLQTRDAAARLLADLPVEAAA